MNPATFLRVLGPEPWNVCYAEPSIRPDDSRYGDNPNRVQRHTQFQASNMSTPLRAASGPEADLRDGHATDTLLGAPEALDASRISSAHRQPAVTQQRRFILLRESTLAS